MAVTSLWAVRGNLGVVLDYAANPEKTDLTNLLRYATQQRKTTVQEEGTPVRQLVTGIHCAPATARQERRYRLPRLPEFRSWGVYPGAGPRDRREAGPAALGRQVSGAGGNSPGQGKPSPFPLRHQHRVLCGWQKVLPQRPGLPGHARGLRRLMPGIWPLCH